MQFSDFKNRESELVGQLVLHSTGNTFGNSRRIAKINKVTVGKKHQFFTIEGAEGNTFSLTNGSVKGWGSRSDWATINECRLITPEEADNYRKQWALNRRHKQMREEIQKALPDMEGSVLEQIYELLPKKP